MTSIYTKTGDLGETGLFGGARVPKDHPRVEAYGEVDELNAALGLARSLGLDPQLDRLVEELQAQLFTVGAVLATPQGTRAAAHLPRIDEGWAKKMEEEIDLFEKDLPPLTQFILPGGGAGASGLHLARTVCRRAERKVVALGGKGEAQPEALLYLNRLSDLLFVAARVCNQRDQKSEVRWKPPSP